MRVAGGLQASVLERIAAYKRERELPSRKALLPLEAVQEKAKAAQPPRDFVAALRGTPGVSLIAEVKRRSPSKGALRSILDPAELAGRYVGGGAAAISVVTDERFFGGSLEDLERIRCARPTWAKPVPLLRKDFIVDPYQIYEARGAGADAVLLIASLLTDRDLRELMRLAEALGMTALVETHSEEEIERALALGPTAIGVNNRDLRDFTVSLDTSIRLRSLVPLEIPFVAESGIHTRQDVERLVEAGVDAALVGEALVTASDPGAKVRELATW